MRSDPVQPSSIAISDPVRDAGSHGLASELGLETDEAVAPAVRFRLDKFGMDPGSRTIQYLNEDK